MDGSPDASESSFGHQGREALVRSANASESHPSRSRFRFAAVEIEEEDEPIESRRVFDENTFGFNLGLSNDILNAAPAIGPGSVGFSSLNSDEDVIKEEEILDEDNKNDDKNAEVKSPDRKCWRRSRNRNECKNRNSKLSIAAF